MTDKALEVSASTPPAKGEKKSGHSSKGWKWSPKKRAAIRLILRGMTNKAIANELGYNERTIRRWRKTAEFHAELLNKAREYAESRRFKRTHETGILTDQLAGLAAGAISAIKESDEGTSQMDLNALQLYLREYREFKSSEKVDFGDDPRGGGGISVNIGIGGAAAEEALGTKGSQSFKAFVEEHMDKVPERVLASAESPQEALLGITEALVENTDIIDELYEEDRAMAEEEAGERATKR